MHACKEGATEAVSSEVGPRGACPSLLSFFYNRENPFGTGNVVVQHVKLSLSIMAFYKSTGSSPSYSTSSSVPLTMHLGKQHYRSQACGDPTNLVGDPSAILSFWLWLGPILTVVPTWGVNQCMENKFSLSP